MRTAALLAPILLFMPLQGALAQERPPAPEPGARVRVTFPCGQSPETAPTARAWCRAEGPLLGLEADVITLGAPGPTSRYALDELGGLEVSEGRRGHARVGAGAGFLAGIGAALVVLNSGGSTAPCDRARNQDAMSAGECIGWKAAGGIAGAALGALVGALIRTERWRDVPLETLRAR
jgi:hypothetical protein